MNSVSADVLLTVLALRMQCAFHIFVAVIFGKVHELIVKYTRYLLNGQHTC